jgi:ribonucleoside-triphosphate reductase
MLVSAAYFWKLCPYQSADGTGKVRRFTMATKRDGKTEVYSRVCGFFRPVQPWKRGEKEEFKEHSEYIVISKEQQH